MSQSEWFIAYSMCVGDVNWVVYQLISRTHVNIVDFIDCGPEQHVKIFPSEKELSEYTQTTKRYFPRDNVHAGSLLKCLLRNILHPSENRYERRGGRSG